MSFASLSSLNAYNSHYFIAGAVTITFAASWVVCSKYFDLKLRKQSSSSPEQTKKVYKSNNIVELCVSDIESIINAKEAGVDSIEICSDREQGGITASIGLIQHSVHLLKSSNIEIHALIRPRAGDFCYTYDEFDVMIRDIMSCKSAGVDGVVVGVLDSNGYIDRHRLEVIREVSKGLLLTFHRAYDVCQSPDEALEVIISAGCDRLLTSGRAQSAASLDGVRQLKAISFQVDNRLKIIAAGGVNFNNACRILTISNVHGVHAGSSVTSLTRNNTIQSDDLNNITNNSRSSNDRRRVTIGLDVNEDLNSWSVVNTELAKKLVKCAASTLVSAAALHDSTNTSHNHYIPDLCIDDLTEGAVYSSIITKSTSNFWNFDDSYEETNRGGKGTLESRSEDEAVDLWNINQTNKHHTPLQETKEFDLAIDTALAQVTTNSKY